MKNPFLDVLKPTAIAPGSLMSLFQEQQTDAMQTSMAALSCRDPMALMALQQAFLKRTMERWTKGTPIADLVHAATPAVPAAPAKPAPKPVPTLSAKPASSPVTAAPKPAPKPVAKIVETAPAKPDDLTAIKGIGPKFAATLAEHGITTYRKLASLSPAEVESLEEKLGFAGRFAREGWIEQAKALAAH